MTDQPQVLRSISTGGTARLTMPVKVWACGRVRGCVLFGQGATPAEFLLLIDTNASWWVAPDLQRPSRQHGAVSRGTAVPSAGAGCCGRSSGGRHRASQAGAAAGPPATVHSTCPTAAAAVWPAMGPSSSAAATVRSTSACQPTPARGGLGAAAAAPPVTSSWELAGRAGRAALAG